MYNPRFPHSLRIQRVLKNEYGEPVTDDEGNEVIGDVVLEVAKYGSNNLPLRIGDEFMTEMLDEIPFGYRTNTKGMKEGQVDMAQIHIALPLFFNAIEDGDVLILTDWDRTYRAKAVRKSNSNIGSDIYLNEVKN